MMPENKPDFLMGVAFVLVGATLGAAPPPRSVRPPFAPVVARVTGITRTSPQALSILQRGTLRRALTEMDQLRTGDLVRTGSGAEVRVQFYGGPRHRYRLPGGAAARVTGSGILARVSGPTPQALSPIPVGLVPVGAAPPPVSAGRAFSGVILRGGEAVDDDSLPPLLRGLPTIVTQFPGGGVRPDASGMVTLRWSVLRPTSDATVTQAVRICDPATGQVLWKTADLPGLARQAVVPVRRLPVLPLGHFLVWSVGVRPRSAAPTPLYRWSYAAPLRPLTPVECAAAARLDQLSVARDPDSLRLRAAAYEHLDLWTDAQAAYRQAPVTESADRLRDLLAARRKPDPPSVP